VLLAPTVRKEALQLPAHHKPAEDLLWLGSKVGTQKGLGSELSFGIAHRHPAQGTVNKPVEYHMSVLQAISAMRSSLPYR
jgi:hypothetical protein